MPAKKDQFWSMPYKTVLPAQNGGTPAKWGTDAGLGCCAAQHLRPTSVRCGMTDGRTDGPDDLTI